MAGEQMDPSLVQDFLTESNELIERLDSDLVSLEDAVDEAASKDLLDGIFRALHTIKGAASFLAFTPLTTFAHAAEDTLNRMRKGEIGVSTEVMDTLLRSVDVLRGMLDEIANSRPITEAPGDLMQGLHALCEQAAADQSPGSATTTEQTAPADDAAQPDHSKRLSLGPEKADLVEFVVADLHEAANEIAQAAAEFVGSDHRDEVAAELVKAAEGLQKTADFFGLDAARNLGAAIEAAAPLVGSIPDELIDEATVRLSGIAWLIRDQADALADGFARTWPIDTLVARLKTVAKGQPLSPDIAGRHGGVAEQLLALDGVTQSGVSTQPPQEAAGPATAPSITTEPGDTKDPSTAGGAQSRGGSAGDRGSLAEQTIRVEVGRLEALLNLVGQLVLNKNRVMGLSRKLRDHNLPHEVNENFTGAASDLDRLTGELQVGIMRTRMQPLAKLFDRYPRVIRDVARSTGKSIALEIDGKETEVDKSVLEQLADPLVHILRNSADHGVEMPETRVAAGKPEKGTIRLTAEHQGSHVRVCITDDGKGLDREVLGNKAVERGLVTQDQLAAMADEDVFRFIFSAGFSTAEKVTDLSGRGVGMDVVRTNIAKLNGTVNVSSTMGHGTTIEVLIPLTVAIMPAMVVGVGKHMYAVPLASITEIVKPEDADLQSVMSNQVLNLRDAVLPLLNMRQILNETDSQSETAFAVIVGVGHQRVGLVVDRLVGQEEVVIKPLDDEYTTGGPFSGATIREDGSVSLILDIMQLIKDSQTPQRAAA